MPRKYKKRDKKAEFDRRPRKPSKDWEARKVRIRKAYGVIFPERTMVAVDSVTIPRYALFNFSRAGNITTPTPNDYLDLDKDL